MRTNGEIDRNVGFSGSLQHAFRSPEESFKRTFLGLLPGIVAQPAMDGARELAF